MSRRTASPKMDGGLDIYPRAAEPVRLAGALRTLLTLGLLALAGCARGQASPEATPVSSAVPSPPAAAPTALPLQPAATPPPPTETPAPTATVLPPTATPVPPTPTLQPPSVTVCDAGCDFTSLQEAIDAPGTVAGDVIELSSPLHTEAGIVVSKDVTIRGLGAADTTVQASDTPGAAPDRVFLIEEGTNVHLQAMTIRHGRPSHQGECGGGILNHGTLTLRNCTVSDNVANDGAGICSNGTLTLIDSSVSGNTGDGIAPPGYECGSGGGIKCVKGTLALVESSVSNNQAAGKGGGIHVSCDCTAALTNSTVEGNSAEKSGGGICIKGALKLTESTVTGNSTGLKGGGVYIRGTLDYTDTVIADNVNGGNCIIGGEGGYKGIGALGVQNNTRVDEVRCVRE